MAGGSFRFASRLERRIVRRAGAAVGDHQLIEPGDHLLVALSGGKDSLSLLEVLVLLQRRSPARFELTAATIHPGYDSFSTTALEDHCRRRGYRHLVVPVPIDEIVAQKLSNGAIPCALCSRIRRGALYTLATELGCSKIALGHHLDDIAETLLMNLFFSGQLRAMAPRYRSDDGRNVVIRPLCYVPESWLAQYSRERGLPASSCLVEGCGVRDSRRMQMKQLIRQLEQTAPGLRWQMLRALGNVRSEHLLDRQLLERLGQRQTAARGDPEQSED